MASSEEEDELGAYACGEAREEEEGEEEDGDENDGDEEAAKCDARRSERKLSTRIYVESDWTSWGRREGVSMRSSHRSRARREG